MKASYLWAVAGVAIAVGVVIQAAQGPAPAAGARGQGGAAVGRQRTPLLLPLQRPILRTAT